MRMLVVFGERLRHTQYSKNNSITVKSVWQHLLRQINACESMRLDLEWQRIHCKIANSLMADSSITLISFMPGKVVQ